MDPRYPTPASEYLMLNFRVHRDHRVELLPSFHLPGDVPPSTPSPESSVTIEMRGADGEGFGRHRCRQVNQAHSGGPYFDFHEILIWRQNTASIAFFWEGDEMSVVEVEKSAPEITDLPSIALAEQTAIVEWSARYKQRLRRSITYLLRYSNNGGATWRAVAARLADPRLEVDLDTLPGGESCIFQVAASAGVRTAIAESEPLAVRRKPRQPHILSPKPGAVFRESDSVLLCGVGFSPDSGTAALEETVWTSNVAGVLGRGFEVISSTLPLGLHMVTLGIADGLGGEASARVQITIEPRDAAPRDGDGFDGSSRMRIVW